MKLTHLLAAAALASAIPHATLLRGASVTDKAARVPVLLELFTSEGCSDCPPAERLLETFDRDQPATGVDLVVVEEHVDYWNHLGWTDPFSSPAFSARQRDYADRLHTGDVYTPQLIVDGQNAFVGNNGAKAMDAIAHAVPSVKVPLGLTVDRSGAVHVSAPAGALGIKKVDLFIVLAMDHGHSDVVRGENAGRSLNHVAVAYSFSKAGSWSTDAALDRDLHVKLRPGDTRVIVFVQDPRTARILGIAHARV